MASSHPVISCTYEPLLIYTLLSIETPKSIEQIIKFPSILDHIQDKFRIPAYSCDEVGITNHIDECV